MSHQKFYQMFYRKPAKRGIDWQSEGSRGEKSTAITEVTRHAKGLSPWHFDVLKLAIDA